MSGIFKWQLQTVFTWLSTHDNLECIACSGRTKIMSRNLNKPPVTELNRRANSYDTAYSLQERSLILLDYQL